MQISGDYPQRLVYWRPVVDVLPNLGNASVGRFSGTGYKSSVSNSDQQLWKVHSETSLISKKRFIFAGSSCFIINRTKSYLSRLRILRNVPLIFPHNFSQTLSKQSLWKDWNVVLKKDGVQTPVILRVVHHGQNPLETPQFAFVKCETYRRFHRSVTRQKKKQDAILYGIVACRRVAG
jgi:hypothetical protein